MRISQVFAACVAIAGMALSTGCATVKNQYHTSDLAENKAVVFATISLAPHDRRPCPEIGFVLTSEKGQQGLAASALQQVYRPWYFVETYDCQTKDVTIENGRRVILSSILVPEGDYEVAVYITSVSTNDSRYRISTAPIGGKLLHIKAKSVVYLGEAQIAWHLTDAPTLPFIPAFKIVDSAVARVSDRLDRDKPMFFGIDTGLAGSDVVNAVSGGDYSVGVEQSQSSMIGSQPVRPYNFHK